MYVCVYTYVCVYIYIYIRIKPCLAGHLPRPDRAQDLLAEGADISAISAERHIYIYIYIYREREREKQFFSLSNLPP